MSNNNTDNDNNDSDSEENNDELTLVSDGDFTTDTGGNWGTFKTIDHKVRLEAYTGNEQIRQSDTIIDSRWIIGAQIVAQRLARHDPDTGDEVEAYWQPEIKVIIQGAKDLSLPVTVNNMETLADWLTEIPEIPEGEEWREEYPMEEV